MVAGFFLFGVETYSWIASLMFSKYSSDFTFSVFGSYLGVGFTNKVAKMFVKPVERESPEKEKHFYYVLSSKDFQKKVKVVNGRD